MAKAYVAAYEPMLTEEQWSKLAPLFPQATVSPRGGQQPIGDRHCFEGILWMLRYGAAWKALPKGYPSPSTCWRRLQEWADEDVLEEAWRVLLGELDERGRLVWEECFADATFIPAKKGVPNRQDQAGKRYEAGGGGGWRGRTSGAPRRVGLAPRVYARRSDARRREGAAPRSSSQTEQRHAIDLRPRRRQRSAAESRLAERGVELICPHRVNRSKPKLQDGRKLRRYRRRWKIERTFAWLQNYRRLVVRYERKPELFQAFVHVACILITLKRL